MTESRGVGLFNIFRKLYWSVLLVLFSPVVSHVFSPGLVCIAPHDAKIDSLKILILFGS